MTLIEVLVAVALLSLALIPLTGALLTGLRAGEAQQQAVMATDLAQCQAETALGQGFDSLYPGSPVTNPDCQDGGIAVRESVDPVAYGLDGQPALLRVTVTASDRSGRTLAQPRLLVAKGAP
jgi:type II secretory pathway pseudopilin PulG